MCLATEGSPSGATLIASCVSLWPGEVLRDNISVLSMALGEEAARRDPLSITLGSSEFPEDEDRWRWEQAGLQCMIQRVKIVK